MRRSTWGLIAVASVLAVLAIAAVASAKPVTPTSGLYPGTTSQKLPVSIAVSKAGTSRKAEIKTMSITFSCASSLGTIPLPMTISSKVFKEGEKGKPLPVKNGKFSYKGPLYIASTPPTINMSATFKSPKKLTGKVSVTSFTAELVPGTNATCEAVTLTFSGGHA